MNSEKLTQKTIEVINAATAMARENGNQYVTPEHLLYALLDADGEFISIAGKSVSGDFEFDVQNSDLCNVDVKTTSGDVDVSVADDSISANVWTKTISGDATNRLYYRGEPSAKFHIQTVSGDITVE